MGVLVAMQAVPALAFGLAAGMWLDRVRRRPVLVAAQLVSAAALATVPATALVHALTMGQLYAVAVVTGTSAAFTAIAQNAFLPTLVGRQNLVVANARYQTSMTVAGLAGPSAAGIAVQLVTAPIAIAVDAVSFLLGAATTAWVHVTESLPAAPPGRRLREEVVEGLAFVTRQPQVRSILLTLILANWGGAMNNAVFVLLFVRRIGVTPAELGVMGGLGSLWSLLGAQFTSRLVARFGLGPVMAVSACIFGGSMVLSIPAAFLPAGPAYVWLLAAGLGATGLMVYNVNQQALRGAVTPDHLLGRANAAVYVTVIGGRLVFALAGGAIGTYFGLQTGFIAASIVTGLCAVPALAPSLLRLRTMPASG